jgi:hypothetical protein
VSGWLPALPLRVLPFFPAFGDLLRVAPVVQIQKALQHHAAGGGCCSSGTAYPAWIGKWRQSILPENRRCDQERVIGLMFKQKGALKFPWIGSIQSADYPRLFVVFVVCDCPLGVISGFGLVGGTLTPPFFSVPSRIFCGLWV